MAKYVIADTHGCLITLKYLLEEKLTISKADSIFFLGDYIDRGLQSAQLIDYLINLINQGYKISCIRGNHEQMLLDAVERRSAYRDWMLNTGNLTLNSYIDLLGESFSFPNGIPQAHIDFFSEMPYYLEVDNFILVHGAINYHVSDPFKDTDYLLWSRSQAVPNDFMPGKTIVHGHTPVPLEYIKKCVSESNNRLISLDGGCVYHGRIAGGGYLVALQLDTMNLYWVENMEQTII